MCGYRTALDRIDAFDMWALRTIPMIPYTRHVTNVEVRTTTGYHPLSHLVTDRRLRLFGYIARSSPQEDHHRAVAAVIRGLPPDWKRPSGRPGFVQWRQTMANRTLALHLPGGRQLFVMTGGALWIQQRSSGVR